MRTRWLFVFGGALTYASACDDDDHGESDAATGGKASTGGAPGAAGAPPVLRGGAGGDAAASGGKLGEGGAASRSTCFFPEAAALDDADVPKGFCAWTFATNLDRARGITVDAEGNALVVAAESGQIVALWDDDGDGVSGDDERATLAAAQGLNHGIAIHDGYLYASTSSSVLRWSYAADRAPLGAGTPVVTGIPSGGHATRTLAFDDSYLYVSVGSGGNVDGNSERSRIRRFPVAELDDGLAFGDGEVFADGLRNEVGLRFDSRGRLWGVENGRDDLSRSDLGGDIHQDNPAEELNLFETPGRFYGYPYCWSEFLLGDEYAGGDGTQWADPSFIDDGTHDDEWCQNADNVVPPVIAMQAHAAPLDLLFYPGGSFPASYTNDLFVTFHGSWNRDQPTGYKVMHIPFGDDGMPAGAPAPILESSGPGDDDWPHRPVALAVLPNGTLLITSDESDRVLALGYTE